MDSWQTLRERTLRDGGLPTAWRRRLVSVERRDRGVHLVFLKPEPLEDIFTKRKWVEVRISKRKGDPYGQVAAGDILLLKRSGGSLEGVALVERACSFPRGDRTVGGIRRLCKRGAGHGPFYDRYWAERADRAYCWVTLVFITDVHRMPEGPLVERSYGSAWVVLHRGREPVEEHPR